MGRDEKKTKEGERREVSKSLTTKQAKKKKNDISKQNSKQGKTGEVERNYKMFDNRFS